MNSEKSYISPEEILESPYSIARPIQLPNAVVAYISDLIISITNKKIEKIKETGKDHQEYGVIG